jgi:exosortase D (VPLPA-CTERM-specific)
MFLAAVLGAFAYQDGLRHMVSVWGSEEYSHGYLIPFVMLYLTWLRLPSPDDSNSHGAGWGVLLAVVGAGLLLAGQMSTLYIFHEYGFIVFVWGLALAYLGWGRFRVVFPTLFMLVFVVRLPNFVYNNLSAELQLISSQVGVWFIRLFDISVYLEGNVIDLGTFRMQVVEACSGLRYLFPLVALAYIVALIYRGALWEKVLIFLSSVPISIFMNALRIGVIGVLADRVGIPVAEGVLHDFEGWIVFMVCMTLLVMQVVLLGGLVHGRWRLHEIFSLESRSGHAIGQPAWRRGNVSAVWGVCSVALLMAVTMDQVSAREEVVPHRRTFAGFPTEIGEWSGRQDTLEAIQLDALGLDDYLLMDYADAHGDLVNLYAAYYASQRAGQSAHSPRSCLPGGGWRIRELDRILIDRTDPGGQPLAVNRVLIQYADEQQLVYYWFQQRGRTLTNEYLVKWYLLWDSIRRNRSDGSLVRLITRVLPGETVALAEDRLRRFARAADAELGDYIPD